MCYTLLRIHIVVIARYAPTLWLLLAGNKHCQCHHRDVLYSKSRVYIALQPGPLAE